MISAACGETRPSTRMDLPHSPAPSVNLSASYSRPAFARARLRPGDTARHVYPPSVTRHRQRNRTYNNKQCGVYVAYARRCTGVSDTAERRGEESRGERQ